MRSINIANLKMHASSTYVQVYMYQGRPTVWGSSTSMASAAKCSLHDELGITHHANNADLTINASRVIHCANHPHHTYHLVRHAQYSHSCLGQQQQ